jgi:hypothetical protein
MDDVDNIFSGGQGLWVFLDGVRNSPTDVYEMLDRERKDGFHQIDDVYPSIGIWSRVYYDGGMMRHQGREVY